MLIRPEETELVGRWENVDGAIRGDGVTNRITKLTGNYLIKIAVTESGWETLYQDPEDFRYWELTYPQSEMHGGGPPTLRCLPMQEAQHKYSL